ncbi:MAG TPA: NADPH-dependent F420 reductase [Anaerolineae bacterium]|nr:NADPH-dependent F420 reductase [Anaerolineae bacterium]
MQNSSDDARKPIIAILGGTGKEGRGLAYRWVKAGYHVIIGSRNYEKAQRAVNILKESIGNVTNIEGNVNIKAADAAEILVLTVPYKAHKSILERLKSNLEGKVLIDVTVPIMPPQITVVQMPPEGSAAQEAQKILGDNVQVISAFHNISYEKLLNNNNIEYDVLVCGGTKESKSKVLQLVEDAGLTGWDAGPIENSVVTEGLTSILLGINKKFGTHTAGIKITGVSHSIRK